MKHFIGKKWKYFQSRQTVQAFQALFFLEILRINYLIRRNTLKYIQKFYSKFRMIQWTLVSTGISSIASLRFKLVPISQLTDSFFPWCHFPWRVTPYIEYFNRITFPHFTAPGTVSQCSGWNIFFFNRFFWPGKCLLWCSNIC